MGVRPCFVFLYHKESYVYRQAFFLISASEMSLDFHIPNNFLRSPFVEDVILFFFLFSTSTSIKFISFKKLIRAFIFLSSLTLMTIFCMAAPFLIRFKVIKIHIKCKATSSGYGLIDLRFFFASLIEMT